MENQDLVNFIKKRYSEGANQRLVRDELILAGWDKNVIDQAFYALRQPRNYVPAKPKKAKKWLNFLVKSAGAVFSLAILLIGVVVALGGLATDGRLADDEDLKMDVLQIAEGDNSYFDLAKIEKISLPSKIDAYLSGSSWDEGIIKNSFEENKEALGFFDEAAEKSAFQDPGYADSGKKFSASASLFFPVAGAAKLKILLAFDLLKQQEGKKSFEELFKVLEVGRALQNSQGPLSQYLAGSAIKSAGIKAIQNAVKIANLNSGDLTEYTAKLAQYGENAEGLKISFKFSYFLNKKTVDLLSGQRVDEEGRKNAQKIIQAVSPWLVFFGASSNFYFEPNHAKNLLAKNCRDQINFADSAYDFFAASRGYRPNLLTDFFVRNSVGKALAFSAAAPVNRVLYGQKTETLDLEIAQLLLAIKAYTVDNKSYPDSLEALVPEYLAAVPLDPFSKTGSPLNYSKMRQTISCEELEREDLAQDIKKIPAYKFSF